MTSEFYKRLEKAAQHYARDAGEGRKRGCSAIVLAKEQNEGMAIVAGEIHDLVLMFMRVMEEDRGLRAVVLSAAFTFLANQSDKGAAKLISVFKELIEDPARDTGFANEVLKKIFQNGDDNENKIS